MKERPIRFNTEMVQAILQGRKTQTRRLIKDNGIHTLCPYGQIGDVLWVRESWNETDPLHAVEGEFLGAETGITGIEGDREIRWRYVYKASSALKHPTFGKARWKPSIHMPYEACRLKLRIINIGVERLHDISEEDARAEGIETKVYGSPPYFCTLNYHKYKKGQNGFTPGFCADTGRQFRDSFKTLWESINGEQSWKDNPWVWVVEFEEIKSGDSGAEHINIMEQITNNTDNVLNQPVNYSLVEIFERLKAGRKAADQRLLRDLIDLLSSNEPFVTMTSKEFDDYSTITSIMIDKHLTEFIEADVTKGFKEEQLLNRGYSPTETIR